MVGKQIDTCMAIELGSRIGLFSGFRNRISDSFEDLKCRRGRVDRDR